MEAKLKAFLESGKVSKGEPFTHTTKSTGSLSNGWFSGSYYIDIDSLDAFWTYYCNAVRRNARLTITERSGPYGPLRVDFDFKSSLDQGLKRQYTTDTLKQIVGLFQDELRNIINPEEFEEKMLWCVVLEKTSPRAEQGVVKDGFHLHFPHFICEGWIQDNYLRDKISAQIIEEKIWNGSKFITPVGDFIDKGIARKPWMLFGSMNYKNKNSTPYLYNQWDKIPDKKRYGHVFDHNLAEINIGEVFEYEMIGRKNSVKYYLPRFMSIRGFLQATGLTEEIQKKKIVLTKRRRHRRQIPLKRSMEEVMADLKMLKEAEIMNMISNERADGHDEWMDVGWTLFNVGQGCDEALEMWIEFSRYSPKFIDGECENLWGTMEMRDKTIASLLAMAKNDSPDEYNAWKETNVRFYLWKSLYEQRPNEYDVAMVVCKMYGDRFICANARKDIWYQFSNHRWMEMDDGITLKNLLVEEVVEKYCDLRKELHGQIGDIEYRIGLAEKDSSEARELTMQYKDKSDKKKRCSAIISALKTCAFLDKVMRMCKLKMYDRDFNKKRDENRNLLGCENGVIDLELGIFRDGRPDDYITFSTGLHYQSYHPDDEEVKELNEYLLKVYPNKNRREYFLDFMASCLQGGNVNKHFLIATGPSDGAKSMTFKLLELTYGSGNEGYFGKFPRELIVQSTGRNSSSGPRPELARVRGKRIMGCQEITKNERINIGFIKEATGNDSFYTRGMYEKGTEINPQFTLCMQCNDPPEIPGQDEPTWSRIRVLDHESKFVVPSKFKEYPVPATLEEQLKLKRFIADPNFRELLPDLAPVLLWRLFERFKVNKGKCLKEPQEVMLATDTYQANNDIYRQFIRDRIERENDEKEAQKIFIKLQEVFSEFTDWYKDNYPSYTRDRIGKNTLKRELNRRLGIIRNPDVEFYGFGKMSRWWGYRFIPDEDDMTEDLQSFLGKKHNDN